MDYIREKGRERFPGIFDVGEVSLKTIWEARITTPPQGIELSIKGDFSEPIEGLNVGTIRLTDFFSFLKEYRSITGGNLDQLFEKNLQQFLGPRGKINATMAKTLRDTPQMFGLYNNGITIVVSESSSRYGGTLKLRDPYIVNGCQTTRTIWDVLDQKLESGATGISEANSEWRDNASQGVIVTKIVENSKANIDDITKFTNSQNAIREQDFIALSSSFEQWAVDLGDRYGIFLETQRGGWEAQKAVQKNQPDPEFKEYANAFDLIKVYGAGWLRQPGVAFGKNSPFVPGGEVFKQVTEADPIDADDLYAAYQLRRLASQYNFGRGKSVKVSRRLTRFLYYFVFREFLGGILAEMNLTQPHKHITKALHSLIEEENQMALQAILESSIRVIDQYLEEESDNSLFGEPEYSGNLNVFLKRERLGNDPSLTPNLNSIMLAYRISFGVSTGEQLPVRDLVKEAVLKDRT